MNFNELLESYMILELSPQELYDKLYADKINHDDFMKIASLDPTGDDSTTGAYTNWLVDQYLKDRLDFEKPVKDLLDKFDKNKSSLTKKNINKFRDLDELEQVLDGVQTGLVKGSKFKTPEGVKVVYEDDQWIVEVPQSYEASCNAYGNKTSWCTASKDRGDGFYNDYIEVGELYVIRNKTNPGTPIGQLHISNDGSTEFQDKDNERIDDIEFLEENPKLLEFFKSVGYVYHENSINIAGRRLVYEIREDGVYVFGAINISDIGLTKIPEELASLNYIVTGSFDCSYNKLTSLEGCPKEVGGHFNCGFNKLTSLKGCSEKVGVNFYCSYNQLTSLKGCPKKVGYIFDCSVNELTSLKGCPKKINGHFYCSDNQLTSLEGAPKEVGGSFDCMDNPGNFTEEDVRDVCKVGDGVITEAFKILTKFKTILENISKRRYSAKLLIKRKDNGKYFTSLPRFSWTFSRSGLVKFLSMINPEITRKSEKITDADDIVTILDNSKKDTLYVTIDRGMYSSDLRNKAIKSTKILNTKIIKPTKEDPQLLLPGFENKENK